MKGGAIMSNSKVIKAIGIAVTVIGAGVSVLSSWVDDKKMEERIEEGIDKALAEREQKEP